MAEEAASPALKIATTAVSDSPQASAGQKAVRRIGSLEGVPETKHDAAIAAVSGPLIQECGRADAAFGDAEVAGVSSVIQLGPNLDPLVLTNPCVFEDAKIEVVNTVSAQDVSTCIADPLGGSDPLE